MTQDQLIELSLGFLGLSAANDTSVFISCKGLVFCDVFTIDVANSCKDNVIKLATVGKQQHFFVENAKMIFDIEIISENVLKPKKLWCYIKSV